MPLSRSFLSIVAGAIALTGCSSLPKVDPVMAGPFYQPVNVRQNVPALPLDLRRVLLIPLASTGPAVPEDNLVAFDDALRTELNRTTRFEVVSLSRSQLADLIGVRQLASVDLIPADFVQKVLSEDNRFGADGVLFVDLTSFKAYPPITVGLRAKLIRIQDRSVLWAADLIFSAADPAVVNSARRHAIKLGTDAGPVDLSHTVLQSPTRFVGFAAATTFSTLPPR